ncbi:MAG: hypothetical protein ABSD57_09320 [Verrucomicrobiota bacterium]
MKVDDIISYAQLVHAEGANLQRGMNFGIGKSYSLFLMSLRKNAPYADEPVGGAFVLPKQGTATYPKAMADAQARR